MPAQHRLPGSKHNEMRTPVGAMPDAELRAQIHRTIKESFFKGEGHRKIWARLRRRDIRTSRKRGCG